MKMYIASDHAGFELKKALIEHLRSKDIEVEDCGAFDYDPDDDYPDFIYPCAQKVANDSGSLGIVLGASGQGEAIVANKVEGIRAALFYGGNMELVKRSKDHNDANVLSLGAKFLSHEEAKEAVDLWISESFSNQQRHARRIGKINKLEKGST